MEFLSSIISGIVTEPIQNYIIAPITKQVSYAFKCNSHLKKLEKEAQQLKNKSDRLQAAVEDATRQGHVIYDNVSSWLTEAGDATEEVQQFIIDGKELKEKKRCFKGLVPNFMTRYQLSKNAGKKRMAINELLNEGGLDPISHPAPPQQMVAPSVYTREALLSRVSILNKVMDALKDPNVNMIGVFGMGGVGKTTLAKEVQGRAKADKLFDSVIFVAVSLTPEIKRIQQEIAEVLGLSLKAEGMLVRANELFERLKKEKKVLLILDDMWSPLELHNVGIPFGDDHQGCKIFVTSRSKDVCHGMGAQKHFPLNTLRQEEAWRLFEKILPEFKGDEFEKVATEISKKCAGLPLLLVKVAKDLQKRENLHAWEDTSKRLSHAGDLDARVASILRSSYENLPSNEAREFFLLCGLFGQSNIRIQRLVRYSVGLDLFRDTTTIKDATNRVLTLIDELKAESLLLDGDMAAFVKMHDLVRDTAFSISSEKQHAFVGSAGTELKAWPDKECTRISLPYCKINGNLKIFDCPKTELLLLSTEDPSLKIHDSFFEGIRKLAVLDISGLRFVSLPSSLAFLKNLHTLCLHKCQLDELAVIGELKQLWVLSLVESEIVELPKEMEQLTQLKILDMTDCYQLEFIPANMLSKLPLLEELYMKHCFILEGAKGEETLNELSGLCHLTSLEIHVGDGMTIPKALLNQLQRYKILIGSSWNWYQEFEDSSKMLMLCTSIHLVRGVTLLLKKAEEVHLKEMKGMKNVLHELDGDGFPQMKHLSISSSHDLRCIINSTTKLVFPKLESLYIVDLNYMEMICHDRLANGSFRKLRILKIEGCSTLAHLFSVSIAKSFLQLEELHVSRCVHMEKVIIRECREDNEVVEFTRLLYLKLDDIPQLKSFCNDKEEYASDVASSLFNKMVAFPNLESLILKDLKMLNNIWHNEMTDNSFWKLKEFEVSGCGRLSRIFPSHVIQRFQNLQVLIVTSIDLVEEIYEIEERNNVIDTTPTSTLFELRCLEIFHSRSLKQIWSKDPKGAFTFQNLKWVKVWQCDSLKHVFQSVAKSLLQLENLHVTECHEMEVVFFRESEEDNEVVEFTQLRSLTLFDLPCLKSFCNTKGDSTTSLFNSMVAFPNLESLHIYKCGRLSRIFQSHAIERFQKLKELHVEECDLVEEIFQTDERHNSSDATTISFDLRDLHCVHLISLKKIWSKDPKGVFTFQNLQSVHISSCYCLKYIFPVSIAARDLSLLEKLGIHRSSVEEVVEKAKGGVEEGPCFNFPKLSNLSLDNLHEITCFYPGRHSIKLPILKDIHITGCPKVVAFGLSNVQPQPQPLFLVDKVNMPSLEHMVIGNNELMAFSCVEFPIEHFSKTKTICVNDSQHLLCGFLARLCSLSIQTLEIFSSHLNEGLFSNDMSIMPVKELIIRSCDHLKHIWKQDSQLKPLDKHLQSLEIYACNSLTNKAPSSSSFKNLAILRVSYCYELRDLITTSTAKAMVQLKEIELYNCHKMTEIVANDIEEKDTIIFSKLTSLTLCNLHKVTCFCSGNHNFNFPCLEKVEVFGCSQMKTFCPKDVSTPKLREINRSHLKGSINATIAFITQQQYSR